MGLAERRAAKTFETNSYPALKAEVLSAATFEVPIEVDWESLAAPEYAHLYEDSWPKVYFRPVVEAFKAITFDDMGKDALKAGLKKIVIQNKSGYYSSTSWAKFDGGVLTLDHEPCTNVDDIKDRADSLRAVLEKAL